MTKGQRETSSSAAEGVAREKRSEKDSTPNLVHFISLDWYITFRTSGGHITRQTFTRHDTSKRPRIYASFFRILCLVSRFNVRSPLIARDAVDRIMYVKISSVHPEIPSRCRMRRDRLHVLVSLRGSHILLKLIERDCERLRYNINMHKCAFRLNEFRLRTNLLFVNRH